MNLKTDFTPITFAKQTEDTIRAEHRELASALMFTARIAEDSDDFIELAGSLSRIDLTEDQRRRLYEAMKPRDDSDPAERMMSFWAIADAIVAYRDRETETILKTALEIALERYGEHGAPVSVNTLLPLLPPHRRHLAGKIMHRLRSRLTPVGWEISDQPGRKKSRTRTYRLSS